MNAKTAASICVASLFASVVSLIFACNNSHYPYLYVFINTVLMPVVVTGVYNIKKSYPLSMLAFAMFLILDVYAFDASVVELFWSFVFAVLGACAYEISDKKKRDESKEILLERESPYYGRRKYNIVVKYSHSAQPWGDLSFPKELRNEDNVNLKFEHDGMIIDAWRYASDMLRTGENKKRFIIHYMIYEDYKYKERELYMDIEAEKIG